MTNRQLAASMQEESPDILLLVEVPRTNDKKELSAEQMFAALHGILQPRKNIFKAQAQEHIGFEIVSINKNILFYAWMPKHLRAFVEGQIYAQYPTAQINLAQEDYSRAIQNPSVFLGAELTLINDETIPVKTFLNFEVDPLAGITATLAKLQETDEQIWIQILARPISDDWHKRGQQHISRLKNGPLALSLFKSLVKSKEEKDDQLSERQKARISAIENKNAKLGYRVKIRLIYLGNDTRIATLHMQALVGAFKQFNSAELNGFRQKRLTTNTSFLKDYSQRSFQDKGFILNIEELASIFHLPHTSVSTPNIVWAAAKTAEPPTRLPTKENCHPSELSCFAVSNFRNSDLVFGGLRSDRGRHFYVIGQTGTGKTGLLELLALSDIENDCGYAIVDPHGDFAVNNLQFIPERRLKDVVYFNPADSEFPIGFNPLEVTDSRQKVNIASDLVGVLKRMFDSWGPRLEYILRYTILALLDNPGSTMLDITRMLTDKTFRKGILNNVQDPVVVRFWKTEFNAWDPRFQTEAVAPVLNKVGAFTANPIIRNVIGQASSSFDIRKIMDQGQILILNLSRGLIGEDNAGILGAMFITKVQLAAMSRADIAKIEDRRPFYLYVDEFQNFATDSFAVILSEARKYGLYLTLANQYIEQMPPEVKSAVFGNVGSIVSFRVSPDDAPFLEKYFAPQFESSDLIQLANRDFVITMTIRGEKVPAFSGRTLDIPEDRHDLLKEITSYSRKKYAKPRTQVEKEIRRAASILPQQKMSQPKKKLPQKNKKQERSSKQNTSNPKTKRVNNQPEAKSKKAKI